jgi:hypothetical protein
MVHLSTEGLERTLEAETVRAAITQPLVLFQRLIRIDFSPAFATAVIDVGSARRFVI